MEWRRLLFISACSKSISTNNNTIRHAWCASGSTRITFSRIKSNGWMKTAASSPNGRRPNKMPASLKGFLQRWLIKTVAVRVAAKVVPGIECDSLAGLFVASLLLGIFNALLRPLLFLLSLPLVILTLGLFTLVINALLLYFVGALVKSFAVAGFWPAFWGSLVISIVSLVLNSITGTGSSRIEFRRGKARSGGRD